ncbi:MAG: ATP phosphoribosyltransferase regulatory subunit, partial [Nanoarchaeota archaeon]|nr:ATP phosphoribosyltransferase regulatory subunit [Nanoarchaeota archaeon]
MVFQKVKGTTDFFPEEMALRNFVFDKLRETAVHYNFKEAEPPVIESMDLLTSKSGDEIRKQIFVFEKKGEEDLGLRFEPTAGYARMFIEKQKELPKPVKWFCIINVWRYERPQKGRLREFFQFDVELFG